MSEKTRPLPPEVTFLPPLDMILSNFKKKTKETETRKPATTKPIKPEEKAVEKIIEKLSKDQ